MEALKIIKFKDHELKKNFIHDLPYNPKLKEFARKLRNEIYTLSQCGFGYSDIAREFNNLGITTFTGKKWYPQTVKSIMERMSRYLH